ncbi:Rad23p SCDLUD_003378 [Saccharomycodes ludwigii]|uniref:Rad23p n=1 Tax=Saccharomycodes ludwigii TaxID=36035 RepID=UPI001E84FAA8|nr:hypothetical protein SCDLUD_003378 [Saccharomycodes ludwigii]KAH3900399.1 hypothetical protein SCDLUD_003378 [Saccharomycodes ludwigii]
MGSITLNFKDFKKNKTALEVSPQETISQVKEKLSKSHDCDIDQIKLIFSGKVLQDSKTIEGSKLNNNDQVIFMISKKKVSKKVIDPITKEGDGPVQSQENTSSSVQQEETHQQSSLPPLPSQPVQQPAPENLEELIQRVLELGFTREEAETALEASNYNPDAAVEILMMGVPLATLRQQMQNSTSSSAPTANTGAVNTEAANQDDLFAQAAAAVEGSVPHDRAPGGTPGTISLNVQDIMQLRQIVNGDPEALAPFLENMSTRYPELTQQIQSNPELFLGMLLDGLGGNLPDTEEEAAGGEDLDLHSEEAPSNFPGVELSSEDEIAIGRLCELGFERSLVIQVYFACDKNEEIAANVLFSERQ